MTRESVFRVEGNSVTFWLKVKPRSSRERLSFDLSRELRLELHAAPTDGQANDACIRYLARELRVPQSSIVIVSGERSRRKLVRITSRSGEEIAAAIAACAGE